MRKAFRDLPARQLAGKVVLDTKAAAEFLDAIGYDTVDVGTLADSWRVQPGQPAYGPPYGAFTDEVGTVAPVAKVKAAVDAATR